MDFLLFKKINHLAGRFFELDTFAIFCAEYLIIFIPVFLFLFYFLSKKEKRKEIIYGIANLAIIVFLCWLINFLLKSIIHRPRPFVDHPNIYLLLFNKAPYQSFPSGHATVAFALAFATYLFNKKTGFFFFLLALLISWGRIFAGIHYPTDILGGFLIALFITIIFNLYIKKFLWKSRSSIRT